MEAPVSAGPLRGKRVAMVLFSYYPADPRPRRAAEALAEAGASVELICLRESQADSRCEVLNGVDIRRVPMARRRGGTLGYLYQYLAFLVVASAIISARLVRRRYDLVYVHNMPDFLVLCGLIPKLFGARILLDLHDPMPELRQTISGLPSDAASVQLLRRVEKWSIRLADAVITVNVACARLFASRSCAREKITVVMNSPDEKIFHQSLQAGSCMPDQETRPFVIMYHGSLVERNGLALAVEAFAKVKEALPSAELWIYGSRNVFLDRVMETVRELSLTDRVHYRGPKPLEQIVEAIAACDVGIIPNQQNIFTELNTPTRIFEYLAMGKSVIAPNTPGITDYFDEKSLIFFEAGNASDLAQKLEYVFHNSVEVDEITRLGRRVYVEHVWQAERCRLIGLVSELVSGPRPELAANASAVFDRSRSGVDE